MFWYNYNASNVWDKLCMQFWEHFEILKIKFHFNIVINIIYKTYYKKENDGFSQVWVIYQIITKKKMMAFFKFESFTKYIIKKKWWLFPSLSHDMFCINVNCLGFICALFWFQFALTLFFLSLCILTWLWVQHIEFFLVLSWSSHTLFFVTCAQLKQTHAKLSNFWLHYMKQKIPRYLVASLWQCITTIINFHAFK
jgi:hypothetical protein